MSLPQFTDVLLQCKYELLNSAYFCFLLSSDHLCYIRSMFLHGADQLSKHLLTVLHCCLCRALLDANSVQN